MNSRVESGNAARGLDSTRAPRSLDRPVHAQAFMFHTYLYHPVLRNRYTRTYVRRDITGSITSYRGVIRLFRN